MLGRERFVVSSVLSVSVFYFIRHNSEGEGQRKADTG